MLQQSDRPIESAIAAFAEFGVDAAYLVPTSTILAKSYFDAHRGVRGFLAAKRIHDYSEQGQGESSKRLLSVGFIHPDRVEVRPLSLYRPSTKNGDPRIWPSRLRDYATVGNLLALIANGNGDLFLINCSNPDIFESRGLSGSPLNLLLTDQQEGATAQELRQGLESISAKGFIPSMRAGDTGVGYTLETLLGIDANSSKSPDYKGIELKSRRVRGGKASGRSTLFAKTPDWSRSRLKSSRQILEKFGYENDDGRLQVYCTIHSHPNPLGIYAVAIEEDDLLVHFAGGGDGAEPVEVVRWSIQVLRDSLLAKHRETFWVEAECRLEGGVEEFHFIRALHTRLPLAANIAALIKSSHLTTDYAIKREGTRVSDKGYLFRMAAGSRKLIFPDPIIYDLTVN